MEIPRGRLNLENDDIRRQEIVKPTKQFRRRFAGLPGTFDMDYLLERMHSGIGSTCALDLHVAMKDRNRRLVQFAHHGAGVFLFLPSAVPRTVVLKEEFEGVQAINWLI